MGYEENKYVRRFFRAAVSGNLYDLNRNLKEILYEEKQKERKEKKKSKKSKKRKSDKASPFTINTRDKKEGYTALHYACRWGHYDVAKELLKLGAKCDILTKYEDRQTALHFAVLFRHPRIAELLLENGADLNRPNGNQVTVKQLLQAAARQQNKQLEKEIEECKAEMEDDYLDDDEKWRRKMFDATEGEDDSWRRGFEEHGEEEEMSYTSSSNYHDPLENEDAWTDRMRREFYHKRQSESQSNYQRPYRKYRKEEESESNKSKKTNPQRDSFNVGEEEGREGRRKLLSFEKDPFSHLSHAERFQKLREKYDAQWALWETRIRGLVEGKTNENKVKNNSSKEEDHTSGMGEDNGTGNSLSNERKPDNIGPSLPNQQQPEPKNTKLDYAEIPWPCSDQQGFLAQVLLAGVDLEDGSAIKKRLRLEFLRWHPDKFLRSYVLDIIKQGGEANEKKIVDRVKEIVQEITQLKAKHNV